jgi:hypothetical protein
VRSRDARPSGLPRRALEWPAEVDWMGLVRSARGERLESGGPVAAAVKSRGCEVAPHLSVTGGAGPG